MTTHACGDHACRGHSCSYNLAKVCTQRVPHWEGGYRMLWLELWTQRPAFLKTLWSSEPVISYAYV